jgi:hypothetical protein
MRQKKRYTFVANSVPNPLGAFLRTSLRTCHLVHDHVCNAHIYVEEDFIASTHGFDMNLGHTTTPVSDADAIVADINAAMKLVDERKTDAFAAALLARLAACRANFEAFVAVERIVAVAAGSNIRKADIDRAVAAVDNAIVCLKAIRTLPVGNDSASTASSLSTAASTTTTTTTTTTTNASQHSTTLPSALHALFDASHARRLLQV